MARGSTQKRSVKSSDILLLTQEDDEDWDILLQNAEEALDDFNEDQIPCLTQSLEENWRKNELREQRGWRPQYAELGGIMRNRREDWKWQQDWLRKRSVRGRSRQNLPVHGEKGNILALIRENQVVILSGGTGCGKTTQVPQFILDSMLEDRKGSLCRIVCTQPRRISAISLAKRVAEERGDRKCGLSVGYRVKMDRLSPRSTGSILYCTPGIVLQSMKDDPLLKGYSHIILDEVHERDVCCDLLMAALKKVLPFRPDLKIIVMSATLNAPSISAYFGNCESFDIPGRAFNVEALYLEDIVERTNHYASSDVHVGTRHGRHIRPDGNSSFTGLNSEQKQHFLDANKKYFDRVNYEPRTVQYINAFDENLNNGLIMKLFETIHKSDKLLGGILVFMPGWQEIMKLLEEMRLKGYPNFKVYPLHSQLSTKEQQFVFQTPPDGKRKIVVATNIAETSITIPDIVHVIDSGMLKINVYNPVTDLNSLITRWESKANATQRMGRAGRVKPGVVYKLYPRILEQFMDPFLQPEVQRMELDRVILSVKGLTLGRVKTFSDTLLDPPLPAAIEAGLASLQNIGALTPDEKLTPLGYNLDKLSMGVRLGKMILYASMLGCLDPILSVAVILDFKDPFVNPQNGDRNKMAQLRQQLDDRRRELGEGLHSDHFLSIRIMKQWLECRQQNGRGDSLLFFVQQNFISNATMEMLDLMRQRLAGMLHSMGFLETPNVDDEGANVQSENDDLIRGVLCAGLIPNVIHKKHLKKKTALAGGQYQVHPKSINRLKQDQFRYPWIAYHLCLQTKQTFLHDTSAISPLSLCIFGQQFTATGSWEIDMSGHQRRYREVVLDKDDLYFEYVEVNFFTQLVRLRAVWAGLVERCLLRPGAAVAAARDNSPGFEAREAMAFTLKSLMPGDTRPD